MCVLFHYTCVLFGLRITTILFYTCSSRSHQLLMLRIDGYDRVSKTTSHGRLTLVDLAGSERISRSEATGIRLVEAAAINKSLSALGQVADQTSVFTTGLNLNKVVLTVARYFLAVQKNILQASHIFSMCEIRLASEITKN